MDEEVEVEIGTNDQDEWDDLRAIAEEEQGVTIVRAENLEPFTMMILAGGIYVVASVVMKWIQRIHAKGSPEAYGQVIDLRATAKDSVYRDKDLAFGQIVIISPTSDGKDIKVLVETYDPDNDFTKVGKAIFDKLAEGVSKSIESIKDVIEKATGDKGKVTVEELPAAA